MRYWGPKLALVLGSVVLCGLGAEVVARVAAPDGYYVWPPNLSRAVDLEPGVRPGVAGVSRFTINSLGIRGDVFADHYGYRILAVGGSTTICAILDDREAWPHLVQELSNSAIGEAVVWVGNVGRPGHRIAQNLLQVERMLDQYAEIDAVLLLVGANDMLHHLITERPPERPPNRRQRLQEAFSIVPRDPSEPWYEHSGLVDWFARTRWTRAGGDEPRIDRRGRMFLAARRRRMAAVSLREDLPPLDLALRSYRATLTAITRAAAARNARVIFITQPSLWRPDLSAAEKELLWLGGWTTERAKPGEKYFTAGALATGLARFNDVLRSVCQTGAAECIDAAQALPRSTEIFFDDVHFTETGARRLADLVTKHLLETAPLSR